MARGRHEIRAGRTRWPLIVGLAAGVLVLALGGVAYAAYRYEQANAGKILPGTKVGGVDVSEMTRREAIAAVRAHAGLELDREVLVFVEGERFTTTPRRLGPAAPRRVSPRRVGMITHIIRKTPEPLEASSWRSSA